MPLDALLCCLLAAAAAAASAAAAAAATPRVLVVSFDGFRHDYVDAEVTPLLFALRENASWAAYMTNIFPTKTFPNHHAIATGVYADQHGVIGSHLVHRGQKLGYGQQMFEYDRRLVPIWILNQQQEGRHSGCMMWLGGEFRYQNASATFTRPLDKQASWEERVDTALGWFEHGDTPANLVMLYFEQPDAAAHRHGTASPETRAEVRRVDAIVGYLAQRLAQRLPDVDVFVVSDHGMADVPTAQIVSLANSAALASARPHFQLVGSSPVLQVFPAEGREAMVHDALHASALESGHFKVYRKAALPAAWRIRDNARVPDILVVADVGFGFDDLKREYAPAAGARLGVHGYDNREADMHPLFIAWGPSIKRGHRIEPFVNVDLYSLWCHLLGLKDGQSAGSFDHVRGMLVAESLAHWPRAVPSRMFTLVAAVVCADLFASGSFW